MKLKLRPGEVIEVRSYEEIAATLGNDGTMEGLPFQAEMMKYCGQTRRVLRSVKKLKIENSNTGLRGINNCYILDEVVCSGDAHGGCGRSCFFLWKETWLKRPQTQIHKCSQLSSLHFSESQKPVPDFSGLNLVCQSRALIKATYPLPIWNPRQYIWGATDSTLPLLERLLFPSLSFAKRIWRLMGIQVRTRISGSPGKTPIDDFDLKTGDRVEVRSLGEIKNTLDASGKNHGLLFIREMVKFCGRRFSVRGPVEQIIVEGTGEVRRLYHTVILEEANCDGQSNHSCARNCYLLWRKIWLRKIS